MKRFAIGDIHGNHKALVQCLERSGFDKEKDQLITLGDIADGWHEVYECVEELLTIKNRVDIHGNHDDWFLQWLKTDKHPDNWVQGGEGTLRSYTKKLGFGYGKLQTGGWDLGDPRRLTTGMAPTDIPESHRDFFYNQKPYYRDGLDNIFVHGGFNRHYLMDEQVAYTWWDRDLFYAALATSGINYNSCSDRILKFKDKSINEVFIGHTQTTYWKDKANQPITVPIFTDRIINLDTGGGWNGVITIMNVDTKEYWQSDKAMELYPGEKGRN